ncbi:MAG: NAD-dependent epimerase/dehydratase family protein [Catalinimonas sp.]
MKTIITGSTGMVGKGVLLECLDDPAVTKVLLINRSPIDRSHPKIEEVLHEDFTDFRAVEDRLKAYDACFHCMGVSSAGISKAAYYKLTYAVSEALATATHRANPDVLFTYVSGEGTDGTEQSRTMWKWVKGKTENMILNVGFKDAYAFRPGMILPERGIRSKTRLYQATYDVVRPLFPLFRRLPSVTTTRNVGRAMINLHEHPQELKHLEGADINRIAALR